MLAAFNCTTFFNVFGAIPARGGSKTTVEMLSLYCGYFCKNLPTSSAMNFRPVTEFLSAFFLASSIACGIISTR
ncbi:MAG: hypothetical protein CM15mP107_1020 [Bacteroidota bacterium]|nr:MAG: hypothetical protein CM15mP107_1020 [Bacteroidota bacterium]